MPAAEQPDPTRHPDPDAVSLLAAAAALGIIDGAVRDARTATAEQADGPATDPDRAQALASLQLLRELRERLAGWETGLIEAARAAGASWAELADPLGVASRQAAERRYLRLRPGSLGSTGEERVKATRDRRAADRTITTWARQNAADLRSLAGQVTALTGLPSPAGAPLDQLRRALAADDAALLVAPLTAVRPHLPSGQRQLAARIDSLTRRTGELREDTAARRQGG
ncbi:HSP18 transcriptional regulator [Streptomyces bacillaris]|uniref:HSP18 transcriptional regulator n=3 Tax=Streptomyces TaxID=1883 RepID=A0A1E7LP22_9ACTN|nr:HSP18 transcriptional regulator [Streptomyces nanshensis]OEV17926.1 HSP18 transcriptional regulator [Streptomyces nanshensis]